MTAPQFSLFQTPHKTTRPRLLFPRNGPIIYAAYTIHTSAKHVRIGSHFHLIDQTTLV